ncbi:MAG: acyl carrier protein [Pseudomonadota bacterium]
MSSMNTPDAREALQDWISNNSKNPTAPLDFSTPIIESGHLDSAGVLELIFLIEDLSGEEIDVEELDAETFRDINTIYNEFICATPAG